jgi:hypothetical protein
MRGSLTGGVKERDLGTCTVRNMDPTEPCTCRVRESLVLATARLSQLEASDWAEGGRY